MIFSSHLFIYYFLPFVLIGYYSLWKAPQRFRNFWLALTGYIFYSWSEPRFAVVMFFTTSLDWYLSLVIARDAWRPWLYRREPVPLLVRNALRSRRQRSAITYSIFLNLATLGFFKYFNFGVDIYNTSIRAAGLAAWQWDSFFRVVLPLGISFYTFQALSYTIDVFRGDAEAMANFVDFSCFVSMLPHLVAGPILKFSFLSKQIKSRSLTSDKFARGAAFFVLGLAKKILLANPCGRVADTVFTAHSISTLDAWFGSVAYAFQIYFDFSGYSDMAIGLGLMFGFIFAKNFDSPYRSESITDFWRRWHISLSTWLQNYLYIPLGGNRRGNGRTYFNLFLTMLLGGLWHGASFKFVIWGAWHGSILAVERMARKDNVFFPVPRLLRVAATFVLVVIGWVFFRAADLHTAFNYLASMFGFGLSLPSRFLVGGLIYKPYYIISMLIAAAVAWKGVQTWDWTQKMTMPKVAGCFALGWLALVVLATQEYNPFIYFTF